MSFWYSLNCVCARSHLPASSWATQQMINIGSVGGDKYQTQDGWIKQKTKIQLNITCVTRADVASWHPILRIHHSREENIICKKYYYFSSDAKQLLFWGEVLTNTRLCSLSVDHLTVYYMSTYSLPEFHFSKSSANYTIHHFYTLKTSASVAVILAKLAQNSVPAKVLRWFVRLHLFCCKEWLLCFSLSLLI